MEAGAKKTVMMRIWEQPAREPAKHTVAKAWTLLSPDIMGNKDIRVMITELGPGGTAEANTHPYEHAYLVLSGRARAHVEGEEFMLEPGCCLYIAPNALHDAAVVGDETFRFVVVNGPAVQA